MRTILASASSTLLVDKSRFIGVTFHVADREEVITCLKAVRKMHPKAKHYCYAYIMGSSEKGFDDGEPAKVAGRPLLELLKRGHYDEILLVVVRYFGGIKLGAPRLLRTYVAVGDDTLAKGAKCEIALMNGYEIDLAYADYERLQSEAKKHAFVLENAHFGDSISIRLFSAERAESTLDEILQGRGSITSLPVQKRYIEEEKDEHR